MNILTFVTAILMLMSILTYARLQTFQNFALMKTEYHNHMKHKEIGYLNHKQEDIYNRHNKPKVAQKASDEPDQAPNELDPTETPGEDKGAKILNSKLNIYTLVQGKGLEASDPAYEILKRLIVEVYGPHSFFRKAQEKCPDLEEQLLNTLISVTSDKADPQPVGSAKKLAEVNLHDEELQEVFYKMIKGNDSLDKEKKSDGDYPSLLNFITVSNTTKGPKNISIYLARQELLMAIYQDAAVVKDLMDTRDRIYTQYVHEAITKAQAADELKKNFNRAGLEKILDFNISKTKPTRHVPNS